LFVFEIYKHYKVKKSLHFITIILKNMKEAIAALTAKVEAENAVIDSAKTLLTGLKTNLDAEIKLLADAGVDTASIQALSDEIGGKTQELADAVTANTPAAPAAPAAGGTPAGQ
jgi:hypothetical protein